MDKTYKIRLFKDGVYLLIDITHDGEIKRYHYRSSHPFSGRTIFTKGFILEKDLTKDEFNTINKEMSPLI